MPLATEDRDAKPAKPRLTPGRADRPSGPSNAAQSARADEPAPCGDAAQLPNDGP
ncbi:MAG: hypothetical protein SF069_17715 [Phycisphaerae bacterium]|nr:hypothetical protein [Phycisphaerae bacterium]